MKLFQMPQSPENVAAWLYQVIRRNAINSVRSESRRNRHEQIAAETRQPWFEASPENSLEIEMLSKALKSQPVEFREVIVARIWGGLTFDQIGDLVGTSSRTASRKYQEGLTLLRMQLKVNNELEKE